MVLSTVQSGEFLEKKGLKQWNISNLRDMGVNTGQVVGKLFG